MRYMKHMDIKRIIKVMMSTTFIVLFFCSCALDNRQIPSNNENEISKDIEDDFFEAENDLELEDNTEVFVINNSIEDIVSRFEKASNEDKLGTVDGHAIYAFKYPELTNRNLLYSDSTVFVRYDDYMVSKYEPEAENEEYIILVYFFNSDNKWDSWYKYIIAKNVKEAGIIAEIERERGYAVWTANNIVMEGEQFDEPKISEAEFLAPLENEIIFLKK